MLVNRDNFCNQCKIVNMGVISATKVVPWGNISTLGEGRVGGYVMTSPCLYVSVVHRGGSGEADDSAVLAKETAQRQARLSCAPLSRSS